MAVSKKSTKKLLKEIKSVFGDKIELSNGQIVNLSLRRGMIVPNKMMRSQFTQTPYTGFYSSSSSANTNKTHLWASPDFKKLKSFGFTLDSVAPQIVDARAKRFNTITDESDSDNFVVFNQNKKGRRKYTDDTTLYLKHGSSTFVFNTEGADINIDDKFTTTRVPQIETNATIFLSKDTKAAVEWWSDMTTSTDRKRIDIYGFNDDDYIDTRYLDSFQNSLDYKLEQDGNDVVIKYRNNLSADADDDSLYSELRIKSSELDQVKDQISELPDNYNSSPQEKKEPADSEVETDTPGAPPENKNIVIIPGFPQTVDNFDADNGKIIGSTSFFGLPTSEDPVIKFVDRKKKAFTLSNTDADFVYAKKNGILYFNENKMDPGWGAGGEILELTEMPKLTGENFEFLTI